MTDLAARYGAPGRARRPAIIATVVVVAVAGLAWLAWAAVFHATPDVRSDLLAYDVASDHEATARVRVVRTDAGTAASCLLRAVSADHAIVGEKTFSVASGPERQTVDQLLRTERKATTVELLGCSAPGQDQRQ